MGDFLLAGTYYKSDCMAGYNSRKDIKIMIDKYVAGTATNEEIEFIETYYAHQEKNEIVNLSNQEIDQLKKSTFNKIKPQLNNSLTRVIPTIKLYKYAAVAAVLLLVSAAIYLIIQKDLPLKKPLAKVYKPLDVLPGTNKAILTLGDGFKIILDEKSNQSSKKLAGLAIEAKKGKLIYSNFASLNSNQANYSNTITTPKGGQYQVVLPDGTRVWLNAASSLTYPELFGGNNRTVKLQGEAYFEVAKNKAMPFHVITSDQDVEVTGTHFNINNYKDDQLTKTTLLEGSVNVKSAGLVKILIPGEQASVNTNPAIIKVKKVDVEEEIAWKNGLFQFDNTSLKNILKQLERWYNVKVNYTDFPSKHYNGMISRSANLSEVLKMLELTGNIKFKIETNRELKVSYN